MSGRRLVGWRVRFQYSDRDRRWVNDRSMLEALPNARTTAEHLRADPRCRSVRVVRVYRRRRTP